MAEKKQTYIRGAAILTAAAIVTKIISAIYKIPLYNLLGDEGSGHFQVTYNIYALMLTISTAGIPVALSRQISAARATGRRGLVRRYFSVALPAFTLIGALVAVLMFVFSGNIAAIIQDSEAAAAIRVLAPAILFIGFISVFEGYAQGHENMYPTATKQLLEVSCKLVFGLSIARLLLRGGYDSPTVTAGAISGVTIGLGLAVPVMIIYKRRIDRRVYGSLRDLPRDDTHSRRRILVNIFKVSLPITLGASFMNILTNIDMTVIISRLRVILGGDQTAAMELYGVYAKGLSFLVLPTFFIVPITISIVPAIAAALATNRRREAGEIIGSSVKLTNLLAMPAGAGICVLAYPIFTVFYPDSNPIGATLLAILGIASYFVCQQLVSTAILQAGGHERLPLLTFPIGGVVQIALDYILVGNPNIGIVGSPIGSLACYLVISVLNFTLIGLKLREKPPLVKSFLKPALCTAAMALAARSVYELLHKLGAHTLGSGRMALIVYLGGAIIVAVVVYAVLIIATRTITREDMRLVPKGERLADILRIR